MTIIKLDGPEDMLPEYDLDKMRIVKFGPGHSQKELKMSEPKAEVILDEVDREKEKAELEEAAAALRQLQPQTELGKRLIELALKGIEAGVPRLSTDEIREYLGRERYEDFS